MQFDSKAVEEHEEVPLADEGQWEQLVQYWQRRSQSAAASAGTTRAYVVSVILGLEQESQAKQAEILGLVRAQGDEIAGHEIARLAKPDPRALFGRGRAQQIAARARECGADLLVVDAELSPSQARNLEDATGLSVREREAVILQVFQRHVKTRKARIQVEMAHLQYLRPRIRGLGLEMDQQAGGVIGSRGPGETASELLARQLDGRLAILQRAFASLCKESEVQREGRASCKRIALVGYTNAGKTSLMNALTGAGLSAADRPFETLDTTSRCLTRHGGDLLLSDTVGFIRNLPARLLASFASTLEEIQEATLVAIVIDAADAEAALHLQTTLAMLQSLDADHLPRVYLFNKIDKLTRPLAHLPLWQQVARGLGEKERMHACCSQDKASVAKLRSALLAAAREEQEQRVVFVPYAATGATALVYAKCRVVHSKSHEHGTTFTVEADARWLNALAKELGRAGRNA